MLAAYKTRPHLLIPSAPKILDLFVIPELASIGSIRQR